MLLSEYREVYASVTSMLQESRMVGEIVVLAMLENEDALFVEKVAIEYEVWNLGKLL